ncbi:unnamed protein product [Phyllotreta striolata]|uniref:Cubilin n=1 Tax=Phyllotreta striolata TaxID=444603 RepID=A0A9N9XKI5_PHYSR|nr:unnamed protein product [Phyllotreta striolata]
MKTSTVLAVLTFYFSYYVSGIRYDKLPRIRVENGHLKIAAPVGKNIEFELSEGSYIHINNIDVLPILSKAYNATKLTENYEYTLSSYNDRLEALESKGVDLPPIPSNYTSPNSALIISTLYGLNTKIIQINRKIRNITATLARDDCASNPCKNGGTCYDMYARYFCTCTPGWEGIDCSRDINECSRIQGTDLGCQNGGICRNTIGSYTCDCVNGFIGLHCTRKSVDCLTAGSELCGHGTCVAQSNEKGYKCLCDPGWTKDSNSEACTTDVNECNQNHPSCASGVSCINVPGSFYCGPCPTGFTGNGYHCTDINECDRNNGGCSMNPMAFCINTPGSRVCGPCPVGYSGDGVTCSYQGVCNVNNGGCHRLATCTDNLGTTQCVCPTGYVGNGVGPNGCVFSTSPSNPCSSNPCVNGACSLNVSQGSYQCSCFRHWRGKNCDVLSADACTPNPCRNDGECQNVNNRIRCKCKAGYSGRYCTTQLQACGGVFKSDNGSFKYPNGEFEAYNHRSSCVWSISLNDTKRVIKVNITKFDIEDSASCRKDWLEIHDGRNTAAPSLGRFCGNKKPLNGTFTSAQNNLYFWFRSDSRISGGGFEITWTSEKSNCFEFISRSPHGTIKSPGSPGNYPLNRDCYWTLSGGFTKRFMLYFASLNIGDNADCNSDYIKFYSSMYPLNEDTLFEKFCNSSSPAPFYSPGSRLSIHFHSDNKDTYPGFQLVYTEVEGVPGCGGTFTKPRGKIHSPHGESNGIIGGLSICEYKIHLQPGRRIKLNFQKFDLAGLTLGCSANYIEIFDGDGTSSGRYCGANIPSSYTSQHNDLTIMSSFEGGEQKGWAIEYVSVCSKTFTNETGSFNISASAIANEDCIYRIERPPGNIIMLVMKVNMPTAARRFYIRSLGMNNCHSRFVEVRDGDHENATLINRYCGRETAEITSTHNFLWIHVFYARFLIGSRGTNLVEFEYTSMDAGCGGILRDKMGNIKSPTHSDGSYLSNLNCKWTIIASPQEVIKLTWLTFYIEESNTCAYDNVQVFDNNTDLGTGVLMGKFCGFTLPPTLLSSSNIMTITFKTDITVNMDGFLATFVTLQEKDVCEGNYYTPSGVIKSPRYPEPYPNNRECTWTINVPPGQQITLNVTNFDIEFYAGCRYDWLEIRNGGTSSSPLIGKYCGKTIPKIITSHTNKIYLLFKSDLSRSGTGFRITWSSAATGCGGLMTSPTGSVISPHYPEPYSRSTECLWKVITSAGSRIQVVFSDINLENHQKCLADYVELLDGPMLNSKSLGKFCWETPNPIKTSSNELMVKFRSDVAFQGRGFQFHYITVCHNTVKGFGGVIESPNFPNDYPEDQDCLWEIVVANKNKINITFSHFDIERSSPIRNNTCAFDYVEIYYGVLENDYEEKITYNKYGRYCGKNSPGHFTLDSDHAQIKFVSDKLWIGAGFRFEWEIFGCGGILKRKSGIISSPNYPNPYEESTECEWMIEVDFGQSIQIEFQEVDVEKDTSCSFDAVSVYNGMDRSYNLIAKLCKQKQKTVITSTGNYMFILFESDQSYQGKGFIANYSTVPTTCGGRMTAAEGFIYSPNYPKNFNKNETCEWQIEIDDGHSIELIFEDVDLFESGNCSQNYVKIFDGPSAAFPVIKTACGSITPNGTFRSSYNLVFVEFRAHSYFAAKGFKLKYQKSCGSKIYSQSSGILEVKQDDFTDSMTTCSWIIKSVDYSKHVSLTISEISTLYYCDDSDGAIKIYNGEASDSPMISQFCGPRVPPTIVSDGSALTINITSIASFTATYTTLDSQCGGTLKSLAGFFSTPGYPRKYASDIECEWTITVAPGNHLTLTFITFELLDSPNCNTDYLEIRSHNSSGKLQGVFCGNKGPENITHVGSLWLLFKGSKPEKGDTEVTAKGFYIEYYLNTDNELNGTQGEIWSPLYPNTVSDNKRFTWRITVAPKKRILLTFKEFYLDAKDSLYEDEDDCYFVLMEIFDGVDSTAVPFGKYCGLVAPEPIKSSSNIIFIQVEYTSSRLGTKFRIHWEQVDAPSPTGLSVQTINTNCGNTTKGAKDIHILHNFTFTSPGFPGGYEHNLKCEWIFSTVPNNHLLIYFYKLDFAVMKNRYTGLYSSCEVNDRINIYEKNVLDTDWRKIRTLCKESDIQRPNNLIFATGLTKVEFISTRYLNGTGFKAKVTEVCGGWLTEPTGIISFDNQSARGLQCQWNITVKSTRTIELTFEQMDIKYDPNKGCNNYLMIRNGKFADSPLLGIGKYCGSTLPEKLRSTGNNLYIKYKGSLSNDGFKLKYQEVTADCGGRIELSKYNNFTEISSPNYPNVPTPHTECEWLITAPSGEVLRIDFEGRFHLTYRPDCDVEYVELRDGGTEYSRLINRYCKSAPNSQFSTDHMLYVKFFTDTDDPKTGFKAKISIDRCGGTIRGNAGELSYANTGTDHINCTWRIIGTIDHYLQINFTKLDTPTCVNDYVLLKNGKKVIEGQGAPNDTIGKYCGKSIPQPITSENNEVIVTFVSSSQSKFFLQFKASQTKCGGTLQGDSGVITSPGYPLMNYLNRYCVWKIEVEKGRRVTLKFNDIDLGSNVLRYETAIRVFDIMDVHRSDNTIITQPSGNNTVESSSNKMTIIFWSASGSPHRGFKATYTSNLPSICEGDFNKDNGVISTPLSRNYGYSCDWSHSLPNLHSTLAITITMNTNLTGHHICAYSPIYVEISTKKSTKKIGQLCSKTSKPVTYRSPFPETDLLATSSRYYTTNFTATYVTHDCGGMVSQQSGTISSPNYPHKPTKSYECAWVLTADEGQVINITKFTANLGNDCEKSFVAIHNGDLPTHPRIGKYCNQNKPEMIISQGRNLWIEYMHDASSSAEGFQLQYEAISTGCGGIFHDKSRNIQSPNFGSGEYPNNAECLWIIESEPGYHIQLVFVERFHLEQSNNCENDFIQIWHWMNDEWVSFGKKCGREIPAAIESSGEKMKILFRSNDKIGGRGFKAKWNWLCGGKFIASKQTRYIISPGYPSGYPNRLNCEYTLSTSSPSTEAINIKFIDFQLEQGTPECKFDNLTIQGNTGTTRTSQYSSIYCDDKMPPPLRLKGVVTIKFKTDMWLIKRGFKFEYRDDSCGGEITKETIIEKQVDVFPSGLGISGLRYYQPKLHCIWNITAPEKQVVILTIINLDLYLIGPMCYSDNLEVYNSLDLKKSNRLAILCGSIQELTEIRSETGKMAVVFDSMPNRVGGFKALVRFSHGPAEGCGGFVNLTTTKAIDSPKIANSDCGWTIVAARDFQIEVTVNNFNMKTTCEGNSTCDCMFLEVRDGASSLSEKIDKYCTTTKGVFRSRTSGNTAYVRVFNTGENNDITFTLVPKASACGESVLIATKEKKWLHSPNFPLSYPSLLKCSYVITGGGRYDKIALHFEAFNLTDEVSTTADNENRCPGDYLQIFENPNANTVNGLGSHVVYSGQTKHTSLLYTDPKGRHIFCGQRDKPFDYYSTGNITISLVSRSTLPKGQGFNLQYSIAGCNRNYTETNGRINNGNDNSSECTFWIIVPDNRTISIYFTSFYMYFTQNCSQSYLEVRDGSPNGTELAKICGYRLPDPLFSLSNKLYFKAVNKRYIVRYDILYTSSQNGRGCGGDIFNNKGKIYSPFYPSPFRNDSTCVWRIRVPVSLHVALKFTIFDIQGTCDQTNLKIQTVTDNVENTVELCNNYRTGAIYRSDSYINIIYKSSMHNGGSGWIATFRAVTKDVTDIS